MAKFFSNNKSLVLDQNTPPENGAMILITWLPEPRNHPFTQNCYTGWCGIVEDAEEDGPGFNLNGFQSGVLLVYGAYQYVRIETIVECFKPQLLTPIPLNVI